MATKVTAPTGTVTSVTVHYMTAQLVLVGFLCFIAGALICLAIFACKRDPAVRIERQRERAADRITGAFNQAQEAMERVGRKTKWSDW